VGLCGHSIGSVYKEGSRLEYWYFAPPTVVSRRASYGAQETHDAPQYHHSDRGVQYCSHDYINVLKANGVTPSMAAVGVSIDNPFAESFNRSLKVEEVYLNAYESLQEATASIATYITCYNTKRLHSSLGYQTPVEFEAHCLKI